jgi:hypothetical protein
MKRQGMAGPDGATPPSGEPKAPVGAGR